LWLNSLKSHVKHKFKSVNTEFTGMTSYCWVENLSESKIWKKIHPPRIRHAGSKDRYHNINYMLNNNRNQRGQTSISYQPCAECAGSTSRRVATYNGKFLKNPLVIPTSEIYCWLFIVITIYLGSRRLKQRLYHFM